MSSRTSSGKGAISKLGVEKNVNNITKDEWKKVLTEQEFQVTRNSDTEPPYTGKYDEHFEKGDYNCLCCGVSLFDSKAKFNSGCGWPAFSVAKTEGSIALLDDNSDGRQRTEVRCKKCDAHLGHVFQDGPKPTGERYCINSCSIDFEAKQ